MPSRLTTIRCMQTAFVAVAVVLIAISVFRGYPAHQDEVFFKAAGLHWAMGEGWRAPEEENYAGWTPPLQEVFASYPPIYPFLFGTLIKVFGFSQTTANCYDACIHVLLAAVLVIFARRAIPQLPLVAWSLGLCWLLSGYPARPDRLAMLFGFSALVFLVTPQIGVKRWLDNLVGVLLGLCAATSVPAAVAMGPLVVALCCRGPARWVFARLLAIGLPAVLVAALVCLPVYLYDARALQQNLDATNRITHALGFTEGLRHLLRLNVATAVCSALLIVAGLVLSRPENSRDWWRWIRWSFVPLVPLGVFLTQSSFQANYHWFLIPWLAVALFSPERRVPPPLFLRTTILVAAFALPILYAQRTTLSALVTGGDQRVERYRVAVEAVVPPGAVVMARDYWWLLGERNRVLDPMVWTTAATRPEYLVLSGYGSGAPGRPNALSPEQISRDYELVLDQLGRSVPTLFGVPLSRSTFSAGPMIYRRKDASD